MRRIIFLISLSLLGQLALAQSDECHEFVKNYPNHPDFERSKTAINFKIGLLTGELELVKYGKFDDGRLAFTFSDERDSPCLTGDILTVVFEDGFNKQFLVESRSIAMGRVQFELIHKRFKNGIRTLIEPDQIINEHLSKKNIVTFKFNVDEIDRVIEVNAENGNLIRNTFNCLTRQ